MSSKNSVIDDDYDMMAGWKKNSKLEKYFSNQKIQSSRNYDPDYFKYDPDKDNWFANLNKPSLLEKYFRKEAMWKRNSALRLFNVIMTHVECRCHENEAVDVGVVEPCFACQKVTDLIGELNKERWIK
jgi:hypothetical protein